MYCNVVLPYVCLYWRQEREIRQLSPNPKALSIHRWHILPFMAKGKWRQNPKWIKGTFAEEILGSIGYLHTSLSCSPKLRTPPYTLPLPRSLPWSLNTQSLAAACMHYPRSFPLCSKNMHFSKQSQSLPSTFTCPRVPPQNASPQKGAWFLHPVASGLLSSSKMHWTQQELERSEAKHMCFPV